jgi:hypothetical protein
MIPQLIKINKDTGDVELHDDVYVIYPFNKLIKTRMFMEGDHDGRKKHMHLLIFKFIYLYANYRSRVAAIPDKERMTRAIKDAGLDTRTFKVDALIQSCITRYIEHIDDEIPSARILISLNKGMMLSSYAIDTYSEQMNYVINSNNKAMNTLLMDETLDAEERDKCLMSLANSNSLLQTNLESMMTISKQLPSNIEAIRKLEKAVDEEEAQAKKLAGNKTKGRREDPK